MSQTKSKLKLVSIFIFQSLLVLIVSAICAAICSALVMLGMVKPESAEATFVVMAILSTAIFAILKTISEKKV